MVIDLCQTYNFRSWMKNKKGFHTLNWQKKNTMEVNIEHSTTFEKVAFEFTLSINQKI